MKRYSSTITLDKTSRGVWGLDTVKGCKYGMQLDINGCYGACYAASIAKRYKIDFSNSTIRRFDSKSHQKQIISEIETIDMPFVRIGVMGDPSECWGHTVEICKKIKQAGKNIIIITKHWEEMPDYLLPEIENLELIINTSISALDTDDQIRHRLNQYNRLKNHCRSVLRIVSCDFNKQNILGIACKTIQDELFKNSDTIDTVLRISENHYLIQNYVVNHKKISFLSSKTTATLRNKESYLGYCKSCPDKCGLLI